MIYNFNMIFVISNNHRANNNSPLMKISECINMTKVRLRWNFAFAKFADPRERRWGRRSRRSLSQNSRTNKLIVSRAFVALPNATQISDWCERTERKEKLVCSRPDESSRLVWRHVDIAQIIKTHSFRDDMLFYWIMYELCPYIIPI